MNENEKFIFGRTDLAKDDYESNNLNDFVDFENVETNYSLVLLRDPWYL